MYYYYLTMKNEQIFAEVQESDSVQKIKNAICKEVFKRITTADMLKEATKEDISKLKKTIKTRIYNTCHLLKNKINIEVKGNFEKAEIKTVKTEVIYNNKIATLEAEEMKSKVLNDNIYIVKNEKRYLVFYKQVCLFTSTTKDIKVIDNKIESIEDLENKINDYLVEKGFKVPTTKEQLNKYKESLIEEIECTENTIKRRQERNRNIEKYLNELNALKNELNLVESMLNKEVIADKKEIEENNTTKKYIVKDTQLNREFKPEIINKIYIGFQSGEYTGLQVENSTIWILSSEVMEVDSSSLDKLDKQMKEAWIKIKILDNMINRLLDKRFLSTQKIDAKGIKYNDRNNILIQELLQLDKIIDSKESKIDSIKLFKRSLNQLRYNIEVELLKTEYGSNKYKIINRKTGDIIYSNNIDVYVNDFDYNIKVFINSYEYVKQQYYKTASPSYLNDTLKVIDYEKNDTTLTFKKYYHIDREKNILLVDETLKKNRIKLHYMNCIMGTHVSINDISLNKISDDLYNDALKTFINNKFVADLLYNEYNKIKEFKKNYKKPIFEDRKEYFIKRYTEIIEKFKDLKYIAENLKYYSDLYKNNVLEFYKKYHTNEKIFNNYLINYRELQRLLQLNNKEYEFKAPKEVCYTRHYKACKER